MKRRTLFILGMIAITLALISWRADRSTYGQDVFDRLYDSPVGQFTLPTVNGTAGTLGTTYQLAKLAYGVKTRPGQVGDLAGDTGNGFSDRYDFDNLDAFPTLTQPAEEVGDLDSLNPMNEIIIGGMKKNPGFRFVHIGTNAFIWRAGQPGDDTGASNVTVFTSIDHLFDPEVPGYGPKRANPPPNGIGNAVLEACEFTVFGTVDEAEAKRASETPGYFGSSSAGVLPNSSWVRGKITKVFAEGFKDYNGFSPFDAKPEGTDPSPQESDDFASQWTFFDQNNREVPVKFIAVYANRTRDQRFFTPDQTGKVPGLLAQSNEAEIDAVGYVPTRLDQAQISGRVINDANANGTVDPDEKPIPGVTINLVREDSGGQVPIAQTRTDSNGNYGFTGLPPATYRVLETNLPDYIDTGVLPGTGNTSIDLNTIRAVLVAGQNSMNNIFLDALPPVPPAPECTPACYNNADMWLLFDFTRRELYDRIGGVGKIFILSLGRGAMSDQEVADALSGSFGTPQERLNAQYVAAQLNTASFPQSIFNRATCFMNGPNVLVMIPGNPRLLELLAQARTVYASGDSLKIEQLAIYLELINNVTATRGIICPFADP